MNVMVVGGGGREHAIVSRIAKSPLLDGGKLYALPGNGGIAALAECVSVSAEDIDGIVKFALEHSIDFAVVAPDDPLVMGAVDRLEENGVRCFGPCAAAAAIEGSKSFAKDLMKSRGIPTARYAVFDDADEALRYIDNVDFKLVIKADGLAKGKGVFVTDNAVEAHDAVNRIMRDRIFGGSGASVVIEERMSGPEVTVLAFTDGHTIVPMVASMDHKRAYDGDEGPNTGGMGVIAPNPFYTPQVAEECMNRIFIPTMEAMNEAGRRFKGCLYFGLMLTDDGPKVIEYNCRFGDPEAEAVLPLLKGDLLEIMIAVRDERLSDVSAKFSDDASCCVVIASGGYPASSSSGLEITLGGADKMSSVEVFHAGTKLKDGKLVTAGGRVLAVTAVGDDLAAARKLAYEAAGKIKFDGSRFRSDIGASAMRVLG